VKRSTARSCDLRSAALLALLGALALASPVQAQRAGGGRTGVPADTAGGGGAPSLRALLERSRRDSDLRVLLQRFAADRAALGRRYDIPLSPVRHARLRAFYDGWRTRLQEVNAKQLNDAGRADLTELRRRIRAGLDTVAAEQRQFTELTPLLPFARAIQELQERRRERLDVDPLAAAQTLNNVLKDVKRMTVAIRGAAAGGGPPELRATTAETASRAVRFLGVPAAADSAAARTGSDTGPNAASLRATLDSWYSFYFGYDPLFTWWVRKPYEELNAALDAYSRALQHEWAVATQLQ
jgi:hypothetical protein